MLISSIQCNTFLWIFSLPLFPQVEAFLVVRRQLPGQKPHPPTRHRRSAEARLHQGPGKREAGPHHAEGPPGQNQEEAREGWGDPTGFRVFWVFLSRSSQLLTWLLSVPAFPLQMYENLLLMSKKATILQLGVSIKYKMNLKSHVNKLVHVINH